MRQKNQCHRQSLADDYEEIIKHQIEILDKILETYEESKASKAIDYQRDLARMLNEKSNHPFVILTAKKLADEFYKREVYCDERKKAMDSMVDCSSTAEKIKHVPSAKKTVLTYKAKLAQFKDHKEVLLSEAKNSSLLTTI